MTDLSYSLVLIYGGLLVGVFSLLAAVVWRGRRSIAAVSLVLAVVAVLIGDDIHFDAQHAAKAGFRTVEEYRAARQAKLEIRASRATAETAPQPKTDAQRDRTKATPAKADPKIGAEFRAGLERVAREKAEQGEAEAEQSRQIAELYIEAAAGICGRAVEEAAGAVSKWIDGPSEPKFSHFRMDWKVGVLTYIGDKIQLQNAAASMDNHIYECDFDTGRHSVLAARVQRGQLSPLMWNGRFDMRAAAKQLERGSSLASGVGGG